MKYQYLSILLTLAIGAPLSGCPAIELEGPELPDDLEYGGAGAGGTGAGPMKGDPTKGLAGAGGSADVGGAGGMGGAPIGTDQPSSRLYEAFQELGGAVCECVSDVDTLCDPNSGTAGGELITRESAACIEARLASQLSPEQMECIFDALAQQVECIRAAAQSATCDDVALATCEAPENTCGVDPTAAEFWLQDSTGCDAATPGEDLFSCHNGGEIPSAWICDGDNDCGDLSDEQNCPTPDFETFVCPSGQSIRASYVCDGDNDCGDLADEQNCEAPVAESFMCPSGQSIPASYVCDGDNDCGDFADEQDCDSAGGSEISCLNGGSVPQSALCDGVDDCGDGTDEQFCTSAEN